MRNLKQIGDSMDEVLKVTIDCEEKHIDKKIPMLDVQVWRSEDKRRVYHMFYEKPIASNLVMSAKTAIPLKNKIATLSQEVVQRMVNTGRNVDIVERIKILNKFMEKTRKKWVQRKRKKGNSKFRTKEILQKSQG